MGQNEFEKIIAFLQSKKVDFELIEHEPVFTSEQAARVRGCALKEGIKAIVLKASIAGFLLACVPGDKKIDLKKLAQISGKKRLFLASAQEVLSITGCKIGSVSPVGVVYPLPTFFDRKILENKFMEFNVGLHTKSVRVDPKVLVKVLNPVLESFSV